MTLPGMTFAAFGVTAIRPTVATTSPSVLARHALNEQHHLGGARERVAAQPHRHGAGMARLARQTRR